MIFQFFSNEKISSALSSDIIDLINEKSSIHRELLESGAELASVNSLVLEQSKEISQQATKINKLSILASQTRVKTKTEFVEIEIPLLDTIIINSTDTIRASKITFEDKWLNIHGWIYDDSLKIDTLTIQNKFTLEIGRERNGLFMRSTPKAYLLNENPYTTTDDITSIQFDEKKPWYEKKSIWLGVGFVLGTITNSKIK